MGPIFKADADHRSVLETLGFGKVRLARRGD